MKMLSLFSGIGGMDLAAQWAGIETVAFCEIEPSCRKVLAEHWPGVPIFDDVRQLTAESLRGGGVKSVDIICGGFPCQDISFAGTGAGIAGERSGLWSQFHRLICELRPRYVVVENVAALLDRGMGRVLGDLSGSGYDAEWSVISACSVGATHMRRRLFIVAYPDGQHGREGVWDTDARQKWALQEGDGFARARAGFKSRLANPSELYRGANGLPFGMERNRGIGNSVSPQAVYPIFETIASASRE